MHRPEHSDCVGIEPQRKNALGIFSDVAEANRPEVVVTAGQNGANGGQRRSSVAGLTEDDRQTVDKERQVGDPMQLRTEVLNL